MNNNIKYVFLIIVTLVFINNVYSESTKIGVLNKDDYDYIDKLVKDLFKENPFPILNVDKDKTYYDYCSKPLFKCNSETGHLSGMHLTYDADLCKIKSLKNEISKYDFTIMDSIELSLFPFGSPKILSKLNARTVKISRCHIDSLLIEPNPNTRDLFVDSNDNVKVVMKTMGMIENFTLTSSFVRNSSKTITFEVNEDEDEFNFKNWDVYSTNVPLFKYFHFDTLKLTILSNEGLDKTNKFEDYTEITNFYLYKYKYFDFDPIPFPSEIFIDNQETMFFGTTFRISPPNDYLDISKASSLLGLSFSNAEGFFYNDNNTLQFPFSKFPEELDQFFYKNNNQSTPLPDIQKLFENTKIRYLVLPNNKFSGKISPINIPSLINLDLSNNELVGKLGDWICGIDSLNVQHNILQGNVPICKICYGSGLSLIENNNYFDSRECNETILESLDITTKEYNISKTNEDKDEVYSMIYEYIVKGEGLAYGEHKFTTNLNDYNYTLGGWIQVGNTYKLNTTKMVESIDFFFNTSSPFSATFATKPDSKPRINSIIKTTDEVKDPKTDKYTIEGIFFSSLISDVSVSLLEEGDDEYLSHPCKVSESTFYSITASCPNELLLNLIQVKVGQLDTGRVEFNSSSSYSKMCKSECSDKVKANGGGCNYDVGLCKCHKSNCRSVTVEVTGQCLNDDNGDAYCSCNERWEGTLCEIGTCFGYDGCNSPKGECDKATSMCHCLDKNFNNDYCNGTRTIPDGKNNNNNNNNNGGDGENGPSYAVGVIFLFVVIIGVAIFIYKRYIDGSSKSTTSNGVKFKVLSSKQEDDEEDNLSTTRKGYEE
ncbi:hypothetical protein DDB_G0295675 [Dictyostelium discoideum AX4]|uniref:EGF-like domain-containing protein n=1 Tax=Dictyostelium discoideum TaxID=44689 RepID=B0G165_DICDI|nr:hypothetical protein DDB_G0295675 [Dictyostelium discoideum AX4]EDR41043.1 hypothetical protein DDB_G0295675 [Dictyostelium discoideum AX4]|eukprot:XP_001733028.1 hypothetical protein DDB_G0295675 [Dictyostelium discoideum AX4]